MSPALVQILIGLAPIIEPMIEEFGSEAFGLLGRLVEKKAPGLGDLFAALGRAHATALNTPVPAAPTASASAKK